MLIKLFINDRLLLTIENIEDITVTTEAGEELSISDYISFTIDSNLSFDAIYADHNLSWREDIKESL